MIASGVRYNAMARMIATYENPGVPRDVLSGRVNLSRGFGLGSVAGLSLSWSPSAALGSVVLGALLGAIGIWQFDLLPVHAILASAVCVAFHWAFGLIHQLGHALAAQRTGHPMSGIHLWGLLSESQYPKDEGELPAGVHIRRALGGPLASLLTALVIGVILLRFRPLEGTLGLLGLFALLDNLLIFTLGALLPLGFTDGSTLLRWWTRYG